MQVQKLYFNMVNCFLFYFFQFLFLENILPSSSQNVANPNTKFINKTSLPDSIERDCQRWESALKKDMELKMENRQWLDLNFKCLDVFSHNRSSKLVISTENMSKNVCF